MVAVRSPLACGAAPGPLTFLLRNSVNVPVYSGTTWICPDSSAGS